MFYFPHLTQLCAAVQLFGMNQIKYSKLLHLFHFDPMRFHVDFIRIKYAAHVLTQNYEFSATI